MPLADYSATFGDFSCDVTVDVEPEIRHRLRLTLAGCTLPTPSTLSIDCLDSMLAPPSGDVIVVTNTVASSTGSLTLPTTSAVDQATGPGNDSLFWTDSNRTMTKPRPTSTWPSSTPSFFQPGAVHCWLFARSTFPHEFHVFPGTQCDHDHGSLSSEAGRQAVATFVKKHVRSPRLFAADQPATPHSPEPETVTTSGRPRDSRRLSMLSRDTEQCRVNHEEAEINRRKGQRLEET